MPEFNSRSIQNQDVSERASLNDISAEPTPRFSISVPDKNFAGGIEQLTIQHGQHLGFLSRSRVDSITRRRMHLREAMFKESQKGPLKNWYQSAPDMRFFVALLLTCCYFGVEIVYGMSIGSLALIADAMHMLSDVIALIIGWYALRSAQREKTLKSTYGWTRMEIVGALVNGTFMLSVCLNISMEATQRIISGEKANLEDSSDKMIIISVIGLSLNLVCFAILSIGNDSGQTASSANSIELEAVKSNTEELDNTAGEDNRNQSKSKGCFSSLDMNMKGVLLHVLGDAMGSVAVICSALCTKHMTSEHRFLSDPIFSVLIVILIVIGTVPLVRDSATILLQRAPNNLDAESIMKQLLNINNVVYIHDFHLWTLSTDNIIASMHVMLFEDCDFEKVSFSIKKHLKKFNVCSATIEPEYISSVEDLQALVSPHTTTTPFLTAA